MVESTDFGKFNLQQKQLDRLVRGQQALQSGIDEVRRSLDRLPQAVRSAVDNTPKGQSSLPMQSAFLSPAPPAADITRQPSEYFLASQLLEKEGRDTSKSTAIGDITRHPSRAHFRSGEYSECGDLSMMPPARTQTASKFLAGDSETHRQRASCFTFTAHEIFLDIDQNLAANDYEQVKFLADTRLPKAHRKSVQQDHVVLRSWTPAFAFHISGCVIHPASGFCTFVSGLRAVFLVVDAIMVPYVLAWELAITGAYLYLRFASASFWTMDLLLNFVTGYIDNDSVVTQLSSIVVRYLRKGFLVDFVLLAVEYADIFVALSLRSGSSSSLQVLKMLRFCKVTRLIRIVAKLQAGLLDRVYAVTLFWLQAHHLTDYQQSIGLAGMLMRLVLVIIWLNHAGACVWNALLISSETDSWSNELRANVDMYAQGLYWSVSTMFSGSSTLTPMNIRETMLAGLWVVMGALFVTSVTSTLAATLIESHEKQHDMHKKVHKLTTYLGQRKTPIFLSMAIGADFQNKVSASKPLTEQDLPFLQVISAGLRAALREFEYASYFLHLPFFRMLSVPNQFIVKSLAFASTIRIAKDGDEVFPARQEIEHAMLLASGSANYRHTPARTTPGSATNMESCWAAADESLSMGAWLCELALFSKWSTVGRLDAAAKCEMLVLSAEQFIKVVTSDPATEAVTAHYAVKLGEIFIEEEADWMTDLTCPFDCDRVIANMDAVLKGTLISMPVLELFRRQQNVLIEFWRQSTVAALEEEVSQGRCHLTLEPPHGILRVVRLAVLKLHAKDGSILMQLVERRNGSVTAKFCLPGTKTMENETPELALERLLEEKLHLIAAAVRVCSQSIVVETDMSATFGLRTKYIKTVFTADLLGHMEVNGMNLSSNSMISDRPTGQVGLQHTESSASIVGGSSGVLRSFQLGRVLKRPRAMQWKPADSLSTIFSKAFDTDGHQHAFALRVDLSGRGVNEELTNGSSQRTLPSRCSAGRLPSTLSQDESTLPLPHQIPALRQFSPFGAFEEDEMFALHSGLINVFKWVMPTDLECLNEKRSELETELVSAANALSMHHWHKLMAWKLRSQVSL
mmetsp:Transcript_27005/g.62356  ORF Transcript_27005/g.62356 Transcript_27005/m.62356 type:complete len:1082 (-) Transcript_27005:8-3253(-)